jgi:hypothetical protein
MKRILLTPILFLQICFAQTAKVELVTTFSNSLKENSGICLINNKLFTMNDGEGNTIFIVDQNTGNITNTIEVKGVLWEDAEAICNDEEYIYIGDFGNNDGQRTTVFVYRIAKSSINFNSTLQTVSAEKISIQYADQKQPVSDKKLNAFDCEAFIATNNAFYFFTKRRNDNKTQMYISNKNIGNHIAKPIDYFNCNGLITDAAYNATTKQLALLGYKKGHIQAFVWLFNNVTEPKFLLATPIFYNIAFSTKKEWQTEGICINAKNEWFISCEKTSDYLPSLYKLMLLPK